ncbi:Site-specific recombinases, DNA invertase Pin homologs, partial [hydrothermal vent metagenome]
TSQKSEGWLLSAKAFDDGGISGGHMQRPALQSLMEEIKRGQVDVVVVYKVDRLTRSLTDFAKLVDIFDRHDVSFVSVTQAFNTTTSMGRLTLNVLLSFAQFEREVTAERIRDKIAASKKKGMWMGGNPPLGYDNKYKKLVINPSEAKSVQLLFDLYLKLGNVILVKKEAKQLGLVTKVRISVNAKMRGGKEFSRGHLYHLLSNPIYVGNVKHKGEVFSGEHEGIIDPAIWEEVQTRLKVNAVNRYSTFNLKAKHMLTGLMFDPTGDRLSPSHSNKKGNIYRYYISHRLMRRKAEISDGWRLPAKHIEELVIQQIVDLAADQTKLLSLIGSHADDPQILQELFAKALVFSKSLLQAEFAEQHLILQRIIKRIDFSKNKITISILQLEFLEQISFNLDQLHDVVSGSVFEVNLPVQLKRRGVETKLIIGGETQICHQYPNLIQAIARAHLWFGQLILRQVSSVREIAERENLDAGDVSRTLPLAFLAPSIVKAILDGRQPAELTADALKRSSASLPLCWKQQAAILGFSSQT